MVVHLSRAGSPHLHQSWVSVQAPVGMTAALVMRKTVAQMIGITVCFELLV